MDHEYSKLHPRPMPAPVAPPSRGSLPALDPALQRSLGFPPVRLAASPSGFPRLRLSALA